MYDYESRFTFNGVLNPHQESAVDWITAKDKCVLADAVGLGKTASALASVSDLATGGALVAPMKDNRLSVVLWLTETSLVPQTKAEVCRFLPGAHVVAQGDPELGSGGKAQLAIAQARKQGIDVLIMGYELAKSRARWLENFDFSMVVLDEAANLKGGGVLNKFVRRLTERTPRVLGLTATVVENKPMELWSILSAVDVPDLPSERAFSDLLVWEERGRTPYNRPILEDVDWAPNRIEEVRELVAVNILRRTPEDVGLPLPQRVGRRELWVPGNHSQRLAYAAASGTPLQVSREREAAILVGLDGSPIMAAPVDVIRSRGSQQALVAALRMGMLDAIERAFQGAGISYERIDGQTKPADRAEAVRRHREGDIQVLLGSEVLERGWNLQHCNMLITVGDGSWNPAREAQREGRICRIGSPFDTYEHLVISPDHQQARHKFATRDQKLAIARAVGLA